MLAEEVALAALDRLKPGKGYALEVLSRGGSHPEAAVFRARPLAGGSWRIVKTVAADPAEEARLARQARRQAQVWKALAGDGTARVPQPFRHEASPRALVMEDAVTASAAAIWQGGLSAERQLHQLQRCGDWLGAFHGPTLAVAPFDPAPHLRWLARLAPPEGEAAELVPWLERQAEDAAGQPVLRAVTHRDLHLKNLILRPNGQTYGLDFENTRPDIALRDLLMLLGDAALRGGFEGDAAAVTAAGAALGQGYAGRLAATAADGQGAAPALFFQRFFAATQLLQLAGRQGALAARRRRFLGELAVRPAPLFFAA